MKKNEMFYRDLQAHLATHEGLLWLSESESPLTVVRLPWWNRLMRGNAHDEPDGVAEERIRNQYRMAESVRDQAGFEGLLRLFSSAGRVISIKRPTKDKAVYQLLIVSYFGWNYVGVKCKIIET